MYRVRGEHGGHWSPAGPWTPQGVRPAEGPAAAGCSLSQPPPWEVCRGLDSRLCKGGWQWGSGGWLQAVGDWPSMGHGCGEGLQGHGGAREPRGLWGSLV